jgi:hypothetical protein
MWHAWERKKSVDFLVGKPEGRRPLERPKRRWEDGLKMDLRRLAGSVWSGFIWFWWRAVVNTVMDLRVLVP